MTAVAFLLCDARADFNLVLQLRSFVILTRVVFSDSLVAARGRN